MSQLRLNRSVMMRLSGCVPLPAVLVIGLACTGVTGCSTPRDTAAAEVGTLLADVEAGRISHGVRVRVSGVVTDDDAERRLAFVGDSTRAIAVHTGRGGLAVARGRRVTIEARVEINGAGPHLADPLVLAVTDAILPDAASVDAGEVFDRRYAGRRIELASRVHAAAMENGRLQLTITSHGVQLDAEIRKPEGNDGRSLIGAEVRLKGVVVPSYHAQGIPDPGRVIMTSLADLELVSAERRGRRPRKLLTTAAAVQALPANDAADGYPVKMLARVMVHDPVWTVFFVQDNTAGIFVFTRSLRHPMPECRPGDLVEIVGETGPGEFAPIVAAHRLTIRGHAPLPAARSVALHQLLSGREDSQFVELTGVVRSMAKDKESHLVLDLVHARERIPAFIPMIEGQALPDGLGVDAVVRVKAVAGARFNAQRQMVGVQLWVPTAKEITVQAPAIHDPFALPLKTVAGLLSFAGADRAGRLAKVRGVVILSRDHLVYLRDDDGTLEVQSVDADAVRSGDLVEAAGFPSAGAYSPLLEDATLRKVGTGDIPRPVDRQAIDLLRAATAPELVRIRARLLQHVSTPSEDVLVLDDNGTAFSAHLGRTPDGTLSTLQHGSVVELTGVPSVQAVRLANRLVPREFRLLLASTDAVRLIEAPSSVSGRLVWALGAVSGVMVISLVWIVTLRRRVHQQARELRNAEDTVEAANRGKTELPADITHECQAAANGGLNVTERAPRERESLGMATHSEAPGAVDAPAGAPTRLRVLIAEDNVVNQRVAAALLSRHGHEPTVVANGRQAVQAWRAEPFDAIFMDVQVPEMDGFEATASIRAAERGTNRHILIVAMTAHSTSSDHERCLDAGMDDFVLKPISADEVDRVLTPLAARRGSATAA